MADKEGFLSCYNSILAMNLGKKKKTPHIHLLLTDSHTEPNVYTRKSCDLPSIPKSLLNSCYNSY